MNVVSILFLAIKNIKKHRKHFLQLFLGIFLSVSFFMTAVIFSIFINSHINDEYPENKLCFLKYYDDDNMIMIRGACKEAVKEKDVKCTLRLMECLALKKTEKQRMALDLSFDNEILEIDGNDYKYSGLSEDFTLNNGVSIVQIDNTISDFSEFLYSFYDDPFICGSDCKSMNDILIPEQYLEAYAIPQEQYNQLIGKKLSIKLNVPKNYSISSKYTICGIIKKECFSDIPISMITQINDQYFINSDIAYIFFDSYQHKKFEKDKKKLDSSFGIKGSICRAYEKIDFLDRQANFTRHVLMMIVAMLAFAVIFHLSVYIFFYSEQNRKYNFLLYSLGMSPKKIAVLSFMEMVLNTALAALSGVILSYVISFYADKIINNDTALVACRWDTLVILILIVVPLITVILSLATAVYTYFNVSAIPGIKQKRRRKASQI